MKKLIAIVLFLVPVLMVAQEKKREINLLSDKGLVEATYFHENGVVSQKGTYNEKGQLHGVWESFDETGKKLAMGTYVNGQKDGKWFFWNNDGLSEVDFSQNVIASVHQWKGESKLAVNR